MLDPDDWVKADNTGEITGVVHSHPVTPPTPSQSDKISCEQRIFHGILLIQKQITWGYCRTTGYKAPLLGRPWVWGKLLIAGL